ncbi:MAG TPA: amino acid permease, partial [Solirubrobacterales bacterium]|nr:amino acid permease [Solirubrobacterales bacterium]
MRPHSTLWLFALVYSSIGFTIYFALGVVADRGLGATPVIFLITGLLFLFTMLTYGEGASMFRERGGSSTFARYAFNELVAFIAGWAILIDYLIVIALAAISAAAYLAPIPFLPGHGWSEVAITLAIVGAVTVLNIRGVSGRSRPLALAGLAIADVALQVLLVVIGLFVVWQPEALTAQLDLFADPSFA